MKTEFATGPWKLCYDGQIDSANGEFVCRFRWDCYKEFSESAQIAATARLIAAAPDLYAALEKAWLVLSGESMSKQSLIDALSSSASAIKKARGEQP